MSENEKYLDLSEFLQEQLPVFDELLSSENVSVHERPLCAASLLVQHCVVEVKGVNDKEDMLGKPWFKGLYEEVKEWYVDRYAGALIRKKRKAPGVILVFNTPFRIEIPLTLTETAEDHMIWVTFPNEVLPGEKVFEWIVSPPNLNRLSDVERAKLSETITEVAEETRAIRVNLKMVTDPANDLQQFISSIPLHIERSVEDILKGDKASIGLAVWEMHLAVEKSLKLLIRQRGDEPGNIHDLEKLTKLAIQDPRVTIKLETLKKLPSGKEAVQARYGEGRVRSLQEVIDNYRVALSLTAHLTSALKRKIVMNNARFLLRNPIEPG